MCLNLDVAVERSIEHGLLGVDWFNSRKSIP